MPATAPESFPGQGEVHQIFEALLRDFGVNLSNQGSKVIFTGGIAALEATKSERILLSLVGALPAAANALLAAQIFELRGGQAQTITVDLQRGHNYIDPNIGMNPTINGQVCIYLKYLWIVDADLQSCRKSLLMWSWETLSCATFTRQKMDIMLCRPLYTWTLYTSGAPSSLALWMRLL